MDSDSAGHATADLTKNTIYFQDAHDPLRRHLLVNKKQTRVATLLRYERPVAIGYERQDYSIRFYESIKKSSGYMKDSKASLDAADGCSELLGSHSNTKVVELLDKMLPPKEWIADGYFWRQNVSAKPASRIDVALMEQDLLDRLREGKAQSISICPIRRRLYQQCFQEVIRQTLLDNPARGILLYKCREELYSALESAKRIWESHMSFCMRKGINLEDLRVNLRTSKNERHVEIERLEKEKKQLITKIIQFKKDSFMATDFERKKYLAILEKLQEQNSVIKRQLTVITDPWNPGNLVVRPDDSRIEFSSFNLSDAHDPDSPTELELSDSLVSTV